MAVVVLLLVSPALFREIPSRSASREARRAYAAQTLGYLGALVFSLVGAGLGSYFVYRQARKEYEQESLKNLRRLLDAPIRPPGALEHGPPEDADDRT